MLAEDSVLLREGITRLLVDAGEDVVASFGDADALLDARRARPARSRRARRAHAADAHRRRGARRASAIRERWPQIGILVLSQYVEERYASELIAGDVGGVGLPVEGSRGRRAASSSRRCARSATAAPSLDPEVVSQLLARSRRQDPLERLTPRERSVLALMAEGRSNAAIAATLVVSDGAVEKHVSNIFTKLDLPPAAEDHRRVLAVLRWLES